MEEFRIGSADAEGPEMFANIVDLAVDPLGRVWVADAQAHEVRVFDRRGAHVRTLGRRGGGPSEFSQISGMDWGPGGNLWVLDPGNSRFTVFDTAGTMVETRARAPGVTASHWPGGFDRGERLYDVALVSRADGTMGQALVRFTASLEPLDTFPIPPHEGEYFEVASGAPHDRTINLVNVPFTGAQVWRTDPEGNPWVVNTERYRLIKLGFTGDTLRVVEKDQDAIPVTSADVDAILESYRGFTAQGGRVDLARIPKTKPPLVSFFFDDEGHPWVVPTVARRDRSTPFDVFARDGTLLGRLQASERLLSLPAPVVRGDRLLAVARGEDGVPSVVSYRIVKPRN